MKAILVTIPKSKFTSWKLAERTLKRCDGTTDWGRGKGRSMFWFVRLMHPPKADLKDGQCYMIYDGLIRGYFDVISVDLVSDWVAKGYMLPDKATQYTVVLANWHPLPRTQQLPRTGFQGWRYIDPQLFL